MYKDIEKAAMDLTSFAAAVSLAESKRAMSKKEVVALVELLTNFLGVAVSGVVLGSITVKFDPSMGYELDLMWTDGSGVKLCQDNTTSIWEEDATEGMEKLMEVTVIGQA